MIFYIFAAIVFLAELIIALTLVLNFLKIDKYCVEYNSFLNDAKPKIKDLLSLVTKISEQMIEFAPIIVNNIKSFVLNILAGQIKHIVAASFVVYLNSKVKK